VKRKVEDIFWFALWLLILPGMMMKFPRLKRFLLSKWVVLPFCLAWAIYATCGWAQEGSLIMTILGFIWCAIILRDLFR
jgi:hypothetical protein